MRPLSSSIFPIQEHTTLLLLYTRETMRVSGRKNGRRGGLATFYSYSIAEKSNQNPKPNPFLFFINPTLRPHVYPTFLGVYF